MRVAKYEETIDRLKPFVIDYLEEHGINARNGKHFKCLNPNCEDKDGDDMSVVPGANVFHCFNCGLSGNIMLAAHHLDNKPISGKGYITDNVMWLCNKYNVLIEFEELTDDEKFDVDTYRAYAYAAKLISQFDEREILTNAIEGRGWNVPFCRKYQIGSVNNYQGFRETLKRQFAAGFLDEIGLSDERLFSPNNFIFTVTDEHGRPVGFAARDLLYEEKVAIYEIRPVGRRPPKYVNTKGGRNVYYKGSRLYGLSNYLRTRKSEDEKLLIFEGYADWGTAVFHGMHNSCALGGLAFTSSHVAVLKRVGVRKVVIVLDGDVAGQEAAKKLFLGDDDKSATLAGITGISFEIMTLPDGKDPDDFLREESVDAFQELECVDAFEWVLRHFDHDADALDVCTKAIPLIISESNMVRREMMVSTLSEHTGISEKAISDEMERQLNRLENDLTEQKLEIAEEALRELRRNPDGGELILQTTLGRIESLGGIVGESAFSAEEVLSALDQMKKEQEERGDGLAGFKLHHFSDIEQNLNGDWREQKLIVIGGKANTGKTALFSGLSLDLAMSNPDDTVVIVHTIDDTRRMFANRWITQLALPFAEKYGVDITLNKMSNPNYFTKHVNHSGENDDLKFVRDEAYKVLRELMKNNLVIKDIEHGTSLSYAQYLCRYYRKKYPNKHIVYVLDNFHKVSDFSNMDERIKFKKLSHTIKQEIAQKLHITVIATMEYHKLAPMVRPCNNNLSETVQMEYDADFIGHLYSEVDEYGKIGKPEKTKCFHGYENGIGKRKPTIEFIWEKNKITDFKMESTFYDFHPERSLYVPVAADVIRRRIESAEEQNAQETGHWEKGQWVENKSKKKELDSDIPF